MDLPDLGQRPETLVFVGCAEGLQEECAITFDILLRVVRSEAKIQRLSAIAGRNAALTCAEAVHEPRDSVQRIRMQDFYGCSSAICGFASSFGGSGHSSILDEILDQPW